MERLHTSPKEKPPEGGSECAGREGSRTTMRAQLCPTSIRIRDLSYSSIIMGTTLFKKTKGTFIGQRATPMHLCFGRVPSLTASE